MSANRARLPYHFPFVASLPPGHHVTVSRKRELRRLSRENVFLSFFFLLFLFACSLLFFSDGGQALTINVTFARFRDMIYVSVGKER